MPPSPVAALLFGLGSSVVRSVVDLVLGIVVRWVAAGAGAVLDAVGAVLTGTTAPHLGHAIAPELEVVLAVGAALSLPLLVLAAIQAIVRQDVGALLRAALVRLPVAVLLAAIAVQLVSLSLRAADEISNALLSTAGSPVDRIVGTVVVGLGLVAGGGGAGAGLGGFGALFLAAVVVAIALMLWFELALRSAAVAAATLFLPLALAGLVWPATAHWARRLGETIAALVLSKVVICGVLALAALTVASGDGLSSLVEGVALLLLAVLAPFSLLKLVPMVEAGAMLHFEGLAVRAYRTARELPSLRDAPVAHRNRSVVASAVGLGGAGDAGEPGGEPGLDAGGPAGPRPGAGPGGGGRRSSGGRPGGTSGGPAVVDEPGGPRVVPFGSPEVQRHVPEMRRRLESNEPAQSQP